MKKKYNRIIVVLLAFLMALSSISSVWAQSVSLVVENNSHQAGLRSGFSVKNPQVLRSNIEKSVGDISGASATSIGQPKKLIQFTVLEITLSECASNDCDCSSSCSSHMSCCTISLLRKSVVFTFEGVGQGYASNYIERKSHLILPVEIKPPRFFS